MTEQAPPTAPDQPKTTENLDLVTAASPSTPPPACTKAGHPTDRAPHRPARRSPRAPPRSPPRTTTTSDDAGAITRAQLGQAWNIEGTVRSVQIASIDDHPVFACEATGAVTAPFYGRRHIAGITPGTHLRLHDRTADKQGKDVRTNPRYEPLLAPEKPDGD